VGWQVVVVVVVVVVMVLVMVVWWVLVLQSMFSGRNPGQPSATNSSANRAVPGGQTWAPACQVFLSSNGSQGSPASFAKAFASLS